MTLRTWLILGLLDGNSVVEERERVMSGKI